MLIIRQVEKGDEKMERMDMIQQEIHQRYAAIQRWFPYGLVVFCAWICYLNLSQWNMLSQGLLLICLAVIVGTAFLKTEIAYVLAASLFAVHLLSNSVGTAFLMMLFGVIAAFGASYGKNTLGYFCVFFLLMNGRSTFALGLALGIYSIYCIHRGFGIPLLTALMCTFSMAVYGLFQDIPFFLQPTFALPLDNVMDYISGVLNDPSLVNWLSASQDGFHTVFIDTIQDHIVFYLISVVSLYALFHYLRLTKTQEKDYAFSKHWLACLVSVIVISGMAIVLSLVNDSAVHIGSLLLLIFGLLCGFACALFLPYHACNEIPTYEEKQALEQKERLSQVVSQVQKDQIKEGWASIAGYEDVKEELKQALEPYLDSKVMKKMKESHIEPVKGLLLFGPPGCGKTLFAKAIASESKMNIMTVAGAQFTSKWVGESDRNLRMIFEQAKEKAPCILFFDELESFLPSREKAQNSWEKTLVTTFLAQMDGFDKLKGVLVIGATNYPDQIDAAAIRPGRFDKCIYISEPDLDAKQAILKKYLGEKSVLSDTEIKEVAGKLERFTAADIEGLIKELYRQNHYEPLDVQTILHGAQSYQPTVTLDMRDKYEKLKMQYNRRLLAQEPQQEEKRYTWDSIAGMEMEKEAIRKYVEKPLLYADMYRKLDLTRPKGTLLFGPPGCGKTLFAKVVASECKAAFLCVNGPELLSGRVGESEEKLRRVFRDAREQKPAIIFFDEFDSIAENRSSNQTSVRLINQLLTEMDGMEELDGVIVLAATNRIDIIDPALKRPGRFDHIVYIGLPDMNSREKQFQLYLHSQLPHINCRPLAELSEGFSCADIAGACRRIKERLLDQMIENRETIMTQQDCEDLIRHTRRSLSDEECARYQQLRR